VKVIEVQRPGGPEALVAAEWPDPRMGDDEILIKVAAAGVNRADLLQRRGMYPSPPGAPANPGLEVAGTVAAIGTDVRGFKVGEAVCALLAGGGYSQFCAVPAGQVLRVPGALSMVEAASLPEAYFTVWSNVFEFGRLQPGERLLVHGGSSGIGVAAIQLAAARGHTVFATAGSEEKCNFCGRLGAVRAINYRDQDFVKEVLEATDDNGVNVILDMIGGSYLPRNLQALATEGRLVMIATQGGAKGEVDVLRIMQRRLVVTGSTLRARSVEFKEAIRAQLLQHVWPLLDSGRIRPVVDKVFAFEEAGAAHAYMDSGVHKGKIVLQMG
jgi:NADPH:quinone reductase